MSVFIYNNKILNFFGLCFKIKGITLFPFIILRKYYRDNPYYKEITPIVVNHEKIHIEQQKELFIIFFYLWYGFEWCIRLFMEGNAYKNISFEKEARLNQTNLNYISSRKRYAFFKYF